MKFIKPTLSYFFPAFSSFCKGSYVFTFAATLLMGTREASAQTYNGDRARWELLAEAYLSVEDIYYDSRLFEADNSLTDEQWYVWMLHSYDRQHPIEHFNENFEVVYTDNLNMHQSVVNLTIIECSKRRFADTNSEYYFSAFPEGLPMLTENHSRNLVTLPILDGDPLDTLCKKYNR